MANIIIESSMKSFIDDFHIGKCDACTQFEHFVNYCVITKLYSEAYNNDRQFYSKVHTGAGGDLGIDGILIVLNDIVVTTKEQVDDILNRVHHLEPRFVFIQAKTSSEFSTGEMLKTGNGVNSMFDFEAAHTFNPKVEKFFNLLKYIYSKSADFTENPECVIYYVTQGKWVGDNNQQTAISSTKQLLSSKGIFSTIQFNCIDANELIQISRELRNQIIKVLPFSKRVSFPMIEGIKEAYIGLVKAKDYIALITDNHQNLQRSLFYENVRGFLGDNPVNSEIEATISSADKKPQFPILNNGVTIITRDLLCTGDSVKLTDFQIVNGCQTSNVLYKNRAKLSDDMMVPIKVISTTDIDVIADVVKSTNRQTIVTLEAFESLKPFHKKLQDFYKALEGEHHLYYERRMNEYSKVNGVRVNKYLVVSLANQLYSMVSMFYADPHSTHRYYGELLKSYTKSNKVFDENHNLLMYYVSALALYKVDLSMSQGLISADYHDYRHHLLLLLRILFLKTDSLPQMNSNEMERKCKLIMEALKDVKKFELTLKQAVQIIDYCTAHTKLTYGIGNSLDRRKEFTQELIDAAKAML